MHVFLTGATGFIGSRVLDQLLHKGYQVSALVRSDAAAEKLAARGVKIVKGDLHSLDLIAEASRAADAVVHLAFIHDFSNFQGAIEAEVQLVKTVNDALAGTGKPFIATSGGGTIGNTGDAVVDEHFKAQGNPRSEASELGVLEGAKHNVRAVVLRLAIHVYGGGFSFFSKVQADVAAARHEACYVLPGDQKFSVVHVDDAASAYLAALEHNGSGLYNISAEAGISVKALAETVAKKVGGVPVRGVSFEEANTVWPGLAYFFSLANQMDSTKAKTELHWSPVHTSGFLEDIAAPGHSA